MRRIRYKDPETGKTLVFLTNNTTLPALTIAALYKRRWQVELFFKWIKQHLHIKRFIGNSENAVIRNFYPGTGKTQIGRTDATCVLIAIVKKELQLDATLLIYRYCWSLFLRKTRYLKLSRRGDYNSE